MPKTRKSRNHLAQIHARLRSTRALRRKKKGVVDNVTQKFVDEHGIELAGDRMRVETDSSGTTTITFDDKGTGRVCGTCTLCCKLLPVPALNKKALVRCAFQTSKGCRIHDKATFPDTCRTFACRWLADRTTQALSRPDRSHVVIDMNVDEFQMPDPETGEPYLVGAYQMWVDPAFPNAWRTPEIKAWIQMKRRTEQIPTLIRYGNDRVIAVFAPADDDDQWQEVERRPMSQEDWDARRAAIAASAP